MRPTDVLELLAEQLVTLEDCYRLDASLEGLHELLRDENNVTALGYFLAAYEEKRTFSNIMIKEFPEGIENEETSS